MEQKVNNAVPAAQELSDEALSAVAGGTWNNNTFYTSADAPQLRQTGRYQPGSRVTCEYNGQKGTVQLQVVKHTISGGRKLMPDGHMQDQTFEEVKENYLIFPVYCVAYVVRYDSGLTDIVSEAELYPLVEE